MIQRRITIRRRRGDTKIQIQLVLLGQYFFYPEFIVRVFKAFNDIQFVQYLLQSVVFEEVVTA